MRSTFASGLRAGCVAAALILASTYGAEQKQSLIGASREQVLERYGEPRSVMAAGGREILFFARERVVLRNGVVVDVEPLAVEPAPRRAAGTPAPAQPPADSAGVAAPAATPSTATPAATEPSAAPSQPAAPAQPVAPAQPAPLVAQPEISIKSVRPPTGTYVRRPVVKAETPPPEPAPPATETPSSPSVGIRPAEPAPAPQSTAPARPSERVAAPSTATTPFADAQARQQTASESPARSAGAPPVAAPTIADEPAVAETPAAKSEQAASAAPASPAKSAPEAKQQLASDEFPAPEESGSAFSGRTYLIAFVVIALGGVYLFWRQRQRQLELAATAVSQDPFSHVSATTPGSGARLTPDLLSKLDAHRFEELVAAYYGKTGVVAERTKGAADGPVHIKISWKGETRPFAFVQCIAQPQGLVDVKPLERLFAALSAEDIRRGYVVTSGKFNVAARDFAEEKQLTLMSGDIFLEKLNALPDSARAEVMQEVMASESTAGSGSR